MTAGAWAQCRRRGGASRTLETSQEEDLARVQPRERKVRPCCGVGCRRRSAIGSCVNRRR